MRKCQNARIIARSFCFMVFTASSSSDFWHPTAVQLKQRPIPDKNLTALLKAGIDPVLARIFAARDIDNAEVLKYDLALLPDYRQLENADLAAQRLLTAIQQREKIVVIADYDADGATACTVAICGLRAFGANIDFIVPDRMKHGYGLTPDIVALALPLKPKLLLTVDNGIASVDGVKEAARLDIDVLITDHHLPGSELPRPAIIVNPNQSACPSPFKHLAGVGVMFYALTALRALMRDQKLYQDREPPNLAALLDLVALGTVADVVPLDHANRILIAQGLRRIRAGHMRPGIRALFSVGGRKPVSATASDLGFVVAPRLNAAGRLADMSLGIRCLLADDEQEALRYAQELDTLNLTRRDVEAHIQQEALNDIEQFDDQKMNHCFSLCVARPEWHPGVIGIVASRLKERFFRPTIVFGSADLEENGDVLRGSGRSIPGLHMRDALDIVAKRAPHIMNKFGGHAMAAGLTLNREHFDEFCALFEEVARETLTAEQLHRVIESDGALSGQSLSFALAQALNEHVWGQCFPLPLFDNIFRVTRQKTMAGKHSRLSLVLDGKTFEAALFGDTTPLPEAILAVYRIEVREYQGMQSLQLIIVHWWPSEEIHA